MKAVSLQSVSSILVSHPFTFELQSSDQKAAASPPVWAVSSANLFSWLKLAEPTHIFTIIQRL